MNDADATDQSDKLWAARRLSLIAPEQVRSALEDAGNAELAVFALTRAESSGVASPEAA
jgi:hypothetical protein